MNRRQKATSIGWLASLTLVASILAARGEWVSLLIPVSFMAGVYTATVRYPDYKD